MHTALVIVELVGRCSGAVFASRHAVSLSQMQYGEPNTMPACQTHSRRPSNACGLIRGTKVFEYALPMCACADCRRLRECPEP